MCELSMLLDRFNVLVFAETSNEVLNLYFGPGAHSSVEYML